MMWPGRDARPSIVFRGNPAIAAVYEWDSINQQWRRFVPAGPAFLNNLDALKPGRVYRVIASAPTAIEW